MAFEGNPGTNKLANVLASRMKKESASPLALDFGEIQADGSLVTNTFPVPVPKGDYSLCRHIAGLTLSTTGGTHGGHESGNGSHSHSIPVPAVKAGDRVLVAWVQNEAVVIDIVTSS